MNEKYIFNLSQGKYRNEKLLASLTNNNNIYIFLLNVMASGGLYIVYVWFWYDVGNIEQRTPG